MRATIRKCDHTGDSVLKEYDTEDTASVKVAQEELKKFLEACVKHYGTRPPVWARRLGQRDFDPFNTAQDDLSQVDEVICQFPMVGG